MTKSASTASRSEKSAQSALAHALSRNLIFVSGKGGVGKTTTAAVLDAWA